MYWAQFRRAPRVYMDYLDSMLLYSLALSFVALSTPLRPAWENPVTRSLILNPSYHVINEFLTKPLQTIAHSFSKATLTIVFAIFHLTPDFFSPSLSFLNALLLALES